MLIASDERKSMAHKSLSTDARVNVGDGERAISAIAGSLLLYFVTKRHKTESLLLLGGGYLLYRAVSGHCPISAVVRAERRAARFSNVNIRTAIVVNRPRAEVYAFWRRLENW